MTVRSRDAQLHRRRRKVSDTGLYVGYIPGFAGAHSQVETLDELNANLTEIVAMILEDEHEPGVSAGAPTRQERARG